MVQKYQALVYTVCHQLVPAVQEAPELPPETYHHIVQLARARGYDTDRLLVVDQSEE